MIALAKAQMSDVTVTTAEGEKGVRVRVSFRLHGSRVFLERVVPFSERKAIVEEMSEEALGILRHADG